MRSLGALRRFPHTARTVTATAHGFPTKGAWACWGSWPACDGGRQSFQGNCPQHHQLPRSSVSEASRLTQIQNLQRNSEGKHPSSLAFPLNSPPLTSPTRCYSCLRSLAGGSSPVHLQRASDHVHPSGLCEPVSLSGQGSARTGPRLSPDRSDLPQPRSPSSPNSVNLVPKYC